MHQHTSVDFVGLFVLLEALLFWLGGVYYGFRLVTPGRTKELNGWVDLLSEFGHFSCVLVMLPMTSLAWMGDPTVITLSARFCLVMAAVFFVAWFFTHAIPLMKNLRWYMKWWWDLPHSLMFLVMFWTYEKHLRPLGELETYLFNACVLGCIYFTVRYANNVRKDFGKYTGRKFFYEFMADFVHVVIFGCSAGMAWWPRYFMA